MFEELEERRGNADLSDSWRWYTGAEIEEESIFQEDLLTADV